MRIRGICSILIAAGWLFQTAANVTLAAEERPTPNSAKTPEAAAAEFYQFHFGHNMGFTKEAIRERSAWLSPDLIKLCEAYFALPEDPDEAPYIEGDPFTGAQDYPNRYILETATISELSARIPITFSWSGGDSVKGTIVMKKIQGRWLLDDVEFADQESIREMLNEALDEEKD